MKESIIKYFKNGVLPFVLLSVVLFYLQDQWLIINTDDFAFSTISEFALDDDGNQIIIHDRPVTSFLDAVKSQAACYMKYNGRFVVHTITQWFCGTKTEGFFVIINSLVWTILFLSFSMLAFGKEKLSLANLVIAFSVLWLLMPNALRMFTGAVSSAVNYMWSGAANMVVLLLFNWLCRNKDKSIPLITTLLITLFSLLTGSMQESFSIGISAGLIAYAIIHRRKMPRAAFVLIAAYLIGTALCAFAPANFVRSDQLGHIIRWHVIADLLKIPVFSLTLILMVATSFIRPAIVLDIIKSNIVIVVSIVVNLLFAVFVAYTMAWQLTCISLFSAILLLQLYQRLISNKALKIGIACLAACCTMLVYVPMYGYRQDVWKAQHRMMDEALTSNTGLISLKQAFEIDKKYANSRLAPILWIYLRNQVTPLVSNDQYVLPSMLSKYLTHCSNPHLIQALLPDEAQVITDAFNSDNTFKLAGNEAVYFDAYTVIRNKDSNSCQLENHVPCQSWDYNGMSYQMFFGRIPTE